MKPSGKVLIYKDVWAPLRARSIILIDGDNSRGEIRLGSAFGGLGGEKRNQRREGFDVKHLPYELRAGTHSPSVIAY